MKFHVKHWKSATETPKLFQWACGDETMSQIQYVEWHSCFKGRKTSMMDDMWAERCFTNDIPGVMEQTCQRVKQDCRRLIHKLPDIAGMFDVSVQAILTSGLNMRHAAAKFVPYALTPEQKEHQVQVCEHLCQHASDEPTIMSRIITGDKSWFYRYDLGTKQQLSQWKSCHLHRRKRRDQVAAQSRPCLPSFSISAPSFIENLYPWARLSIKNLTVKLWRAWRRAFDESDWICGTHEELDSPRQRCALLPSAPNSWVSQQTHHVVASTSALVFGFGSCRLLPFP